MSEKHEGNASTVTPESEEAAHEPAPEPGTAPAEPAAEDAPEVAAEPDTAPAEPEAEPVSAEEPAEGAGDGEPAPETPLAEAETAEETADEAPEAVEAGVEEPADAPAQALETAREAVTAAGEGPETAEAAGEATTEKAEEDKAEEDKAEEDKAEEEKADAEEGGEAATEEKPAEEDPMPTDEVSLRLLDALEKGTPIQGKVFGWNQGGYHVLIDGLLAFCPRSGIDAGNPKSPKKYIEKTYRFHVVEHRRQGNRFVLSRTKLVEEELAKQAAKAREKLAVGAELDGRVSSLTNFGAFVDLGGGVEGLVHISELAHTNVNHPKEVVKKGQNVKVKVLKIEEDGNRISLSMKALQPDPWKEFADGHPRGSEFTGKITGKTDFGVFAEVAEGMEGLVHVSALPPGTSLEDESLEPGKEISGWVKEVDLKRRRISLSLRPVPTSDPWKAVGERYPEGDSVTGTVEEIAPFGVFINLEPGLTGLLPNSEMKLPRGTNAARVYAPGTEVTVQVAKIEPKRKRLTLVPEGSKVEGSRSDFKEFKKRTQENLGGGMPTLAAAFAKLKENGDDEGS